jgi:hypothetical protein
VKTSVLSTIIPKPDEKMSDEKSDETRYTTLDSYFKQAMAKRKLNMEEEGNVKFIPKKKKMLRSQQ